MKLKKCLFIVLLFIGVLTGCGTKKRVASMPQGKSDVASVCTQVVQNEPLFQTLNLSKINTEVMMNGQTFHLYSSLKMIPDSAIFISLQPLFGFEMFRLELYPGRFRVIDKMNRLYFESGYEYLQHQTRLPIDFNLFQNIFAYRLFVLGRVLDKSNYNRVFSLEALNEKHLLTSTSGDGRVAHRIAINSEFLKEQLDLTLFLEGSGVSITYSDFLLQRGMKYPGLIQVTFNSSSFLFSGKFEVNKMSLDKEVDLLPVLLDRYSRVAFNQLFTK